MKRPTIADVAKRAGVTKAAVSFALNDQPGVSAATRERILAIAAEVGFQPSSAARALSDGRADAFGLVIGRPGRLLGIEPYFMQLISGIQAELARQRMTLLFTLAEDHEAEMALYRAWWAQRRVDGVFLVDLQSDDPRVPVLEEPAHARLRHGRAAGSRSLPAVSLNIRAAARPDRRPPGRSRAPPDRPGHRPAPLLAHPGRGPPPWPKPPPGPGSRSRPPKPTTPGRARREPPGNC